LEENKILYEKHMESQERLFVFLDLLGCVFMFFAWDGIFLSSTIDAKVESLILLGVSLIWIPMLKIVKENVFY
jgi:hypothetical protein